MRKILLLSMLAFLPAVGMNAQCVMSANDVELTSGETADFELNLVVDNQYYKETSFEFQLPKGFSITTENDGTTLSIYGNSTLYVGNKLIYQGRQRDMSCANNYLGDGLYRVVTSSISFTNYINNLNAYFVSGTIKADETVTSGTYTVTVRNISITDNVPDGDKYLSRQYFLPDFTFNIIYTKPAKTYDLTVTDATMATMYLDYAVSVPKDVLGVYYVNGMTGNTLNMAELTEIPANTGVIVLANPGTYTFTETTNSVAPVSNNYLKGVNEATAVSELGSTIYTLGRGKNAGLLGFHKYTGSTLAAHKAYMTDETGNVNAFNLAFPDGTTFINRLSIDSKTQEIYDLQGRRVEHPTSGVYIINGVKTVVK